MPWFLVPFPVPFPAPSYVGLVTAGSLLCACAAALRLLFPALRSFLFLGVAQKALWGWFFTYAIAGAISLTVVLTWSTATDLAIGFAWSAGIYTVLTALRLAVRRGWTRLAPRQR